MTRQSISLLLLGLVAAPAAGGEPDSAGVEFFEKKIRPVLAERCYKCHSAGAKKKRGGLLLDTRAGMRKGGDTGPALVPGKPGESLLLKAIRHEDREMPPKEKLPPAVIADFEKWIAMGAPDPRTGAAGAAKANPIDWRKARQHWAYQPIRNPTPPEVKNKSRVTSPIDTFILARLEAKGISPSPPADRRTLIRRAYIDLIGLPPTYEEVETFINDTRPDAFARIVDRLLSSPHYGERWGRHWLDVARFAETKDLVLLYGKDRIRPYAYTYRDYVIRALNADTSYDRFIHEQLAADKLGPDLEPWRLAAMGFLTLGKLFDNNLPDIYDDQIDTVTRGLLGLTVACARCHDHKYDAIPTEDYYSLYGVFASSEKPIELPLTADPKLTPGYAEFEKKAAPKREELRKHIDAQYQHLTETARMRVADYLVRVATEAPDPLETAVYFLSLSPDDLRPQIVNRWRRYVEKHAAPDNPVFGPWHDLMRLPDEGFAEAAAKVLEHWRQVPAGIGRGQVNPLLKKALSGAKPAGKGDVARLYGELLKRVYEESKKPASPMSAEESAARRQLLEILTGRDGPTYFPRRNAFLYMARVERGRYSGLLQELDKMAVHSPGAPPRAMVLTDAAQLTDPRVFVRGNPGRRGKSVPRAFLQLLSPDGREPFTGGSGRLDLARAITAPDNPLTARVMVNRVWMWHFGEPLVSTPSDFGTRSTPPTHPKLLDHLAWTFQKDGWSLKKLHRHIMLSSTYRQASLDRPECRTVDPENRLLWRFHRRRLDLESMRDSLLAVSGRLDRTLFGRPTDAAKDPKDRRRTVYGLVDRQDVPGLYRAFDFASPDQTAARRPSTTVPQQALFGMNSAFMIEQAKALAAREEVAGASDPKRRVAALYRLVLQREPTDGEVELALRFVAAGAEGSKLTPWEQYAQVLLLTNEFMFVD